MEHQCSEDGPRIASASGDGASSSSSPLGVDPPPLPHDWSDVSPQSSKVSPTDENKPQECSPTNSSPYQNVSLGAPSNSQKGLGSPQSQPTPEDEPKPRRCLICNPVLICLLLGMIVAMGSIAMTVCGYFSHEIAKQAVVVGNDTVTTIDAELESEIKRFKTIGPILIGLGSFISMCACVLLCEARDEKKRSNKTLQTEQLQEEDYTTRQKHLYALHCEILECEAQHKHCPLYHETGACSATNPRQDATCVDESSHSSPVVLVHGPSLSEDKQRTDFQESNESEAAKVALLREQTGIKTTDRASIPTCSKYDGLSQQETSFTTTPWTGDKTAGIDSPPIKTKYSKPQRPTNLSPIKSRSVNGPIGFSSMPPVEGVCLCGAEVPKPPRSKKGKRVKRGTRDKKGKELDNMSAGSDTESAASVPKNAELITHVNPLHDIPLQSFPNKSPHRTLDSPAPGAAGITPDIGGATAIMSSVIKTDPVHRPRTSDTYYKDDDGVDPVWVKQSPPDSTSNNNKRVSGNIDKASHLDVGGALCNAVTDKPCSISETPCDKNSNVSSMSSMQHSPRTTPSTIMYDVIHGRRQNAHSSQSEVVL